MIHRKNTLFGSNDFHYCFIITQGRIDVTRLGKDFLYKNIPFLKDGIGAFTERVFIVTILSRRNEENCQ